MRIVQAVGWFFPERTGGTEIYVAGLARRLGARGHHVEIVSPEPGAASPRSYVHEGTTVHRFPIPSTLTREQAQGRAPITDGVWFSNWLREFRPDVVHFHTLVPGLDLAEVEASRAAAGRVIATTHSSSLGNLCARGTLMRWGQTPCDGPDGIQLCAACDLQKRGLPRAAAQAVALVPPAIGAGLRHLPGKVGTALGSSAAIAFNRTRQHRLLEAVDKFVLLTAAAADIVARNGAPAGKIALNRLGIDHGTARKPGPAARPTHRPVRIGYVGRFDPIKGIFDLARAAVALPADAAVTIDLRGPIDTRESRAAFSEVAALVAGHPRVTMGEPLAPSAVAAHLASLDVLCCPSVCLEGGPTVAIEAHAVGTPVIGTRIGGLAELVADGRNGALVEPGDWRALAQLMDAIGRDPAGTVDAWRAMLPPARTMDQVADDYLELYVA